MTFSRLGSAFRSSALVVLMFALVYNVSFLPVPSISTGRVALLILLAFAGWRGVSALEGFARDNLLATVVFLAMAVHAAILYMTDPAADWMQLSRSINFLLLAVAAAVLFRTVIGSGSGAFVSLFVAATTIQSALILFSYVTPSYRVWLSGLVVQSGAIPLTSPYQAPGFSNSSGAALSVIQGAAFFAAVYGAQRVPASAAWKYVVAAVLAFASTVVTGRTGLIMSVGFFAALLFTTLTLRKIALGAIAFATAAAVVWYADAIVAFVSQYNSQFGITAEWSLGVFRRGADDIVLRDIASQPVPHVSADTIVGTGRVADVFGNASGNDSGYVQTYFAAGLIMAAAFYAALALMLLKHAFAARDRWPLLVLLLVMMVVERKEPFIYKYALPFFVIGLTTAASAEQQGIERAAS